MSETARRSLSSIRVKTTPTRAGLSRAMRPRGLQVRLFALRRTESRSERAIFWCSEPFGMWRFQGGARLGDPSGSALEAAVPWGRAGDASFRQVNARAPSLAGIVRSGGVPGDGGVAHRLSSFLGALFAEAANDDDQRFRHDDADLGNRAGGTVPHPSQVLARGLGAFCGGSTKKARSFRSAPCL